MTRRILSDFLSSRSENFFQKDQKDPKNGEYSILNGIVTQLTYQQLSSQANCELKRLTVIIPGHNPILNPIIIEICVFGILMKT